jgi:hypothetical protein
MRTTKVAFRGSLCLAILVLLFGSFAEAHHDSAPQGQHVMPNGQLMNDQDMGAGNVAASPKSPLSGLWFIVGFLGLFVLAIWLLARSTRKNPVS